MFLELRWEGHGRCRPAEGGQQWSCAAVRPFATVDGDVQAWLCSTGVFSAVLQPDNVCEHRPGLHAMLDWLINCKCFLITSLRHTQVGNTGRSRISSGSVVRGAGAAPSLPAPHPKAAFLWGYTDFPLALAFRIRPSFSVRSAKPFSWLVFWYSAIGDFCKDV